MDNAARRCFSRRGEIACYADTEFAITLIAPINMIDTDVRFPLQLQANLVWHRQQGFHMRTLADGRGLVRIDFLAILDEEASTGDQVLELKGRLRICENLEKVPFHSNARSAYGVTPPP